MKKPSEKELFYICSILSIIDEKIYAGEINCVEEIKEEEKIKNAVREYKIESNREIITPENVEKLKGKSAPKSKIIIITIFKGMVMVEMTENQESKITMIEQNDPNSCSFMNEYGLISAYGTCKTPFDITASVPVEFEKTYIEQIENLEPKKLEKIII